MSIVGRGGTTDGRTGHAVEDDVTTRRDARQRIREHAHAEPAVEDEPLGEEHRQPQQLAQDAGHRCFAFVHVAHDRDAQTAGEDQPERLRHRVDVDDVGPQLAQQADLGRYRPGGHAEQLQQASRREVRPAQHRSRRQAHLAPEVSDLVEQGSRVLGRRHDDPPPALAQPGDAFDEHARRAVQVGVGIGREDRRGADFRGRHGCSRRRRRGGQANGGRATALSTVSEQERNGALHAEGPSGAKWSDP